MDDHENVLNDLNKNISNRTRSEESSAAREECFKIGQVLSIYSSVLPRIHLINRKRGTEWD
jgi:hypothetical protein